MTENVVPFPDLFERVARYADQLAQSEQLADRDSLTHAAELSELYEAREWVAEWNAESPIKPRTAYIGGRPPQEDSRHRFAQWLAWRLDATGHRKILSRHCYYLLNAHAVRRVIRTSAKNLPDSAAAVRPLNWLIAHKYERFIDEVWARAVELADGEKVTSEHTKAALAEWKRANSGAVLVSIRSSRAERDRQKAQTAVDVLISHGDVDELVRFNDWIAKRLGDALTELGVTLR